LVDPEREPNTFRVSSPTDVESGHQITSYAAVTSDTV